VELGGQMAPFELIGLLGKFWAYIVFFLIGIGFGVVLELSGFGDSRKLAAQFYLKEMRVLKVMFTAILVALVLIFLSSAFGFLDFKNIWINTTYLNTAILGGLIMGVGFIIGGFCPGTSLVASSTLKLDGIFFFLGVFIGVGVFGETVSLFQDFYENGGRERYMLTDVFGVSTGFMVFAIVVLAIFIFYGAEVAEKIFGEGKILEEIDFFPRKKRYLFAAISLALLALIVWVKGQPDPETKWNYMSKIYQPILEKREVYVHPAELKELMGERSLKLRILDIRSESDFNLFHLRDSYHTNFFEITKKETIDQFISEASNTVTILVSNQESDSTKAWKLLRASGVMNLYILEGGINNWLDVYPLSTKYAILKNSGGDESLKYTIFQSGGSHYENAYPIFGHEDGHGLIEFTKKVKMQKKRAVMGGCG
jgi:uncharacterized membrane protein/rhodanese-related sulfurtransferase